MRFGQSGGRPFGESNQNYEFQLIADRICPRLFATPPRPYGGRRLSLAWAGGVDFHGPTNLYDPKTDAIVFSQIMLRSYRATLRSNPRANENHAVESSREAKSIT